MNAPIMKDMDRLEHDKNEGFYDKELDMSFDDLTEWLSFKYNKTWNEVL